MTGEELSTTRLPVSVELNLLQAKAMEILEASGVDKVCACGSLSLVMDGQVLPDKGSLEDFRTSHSSEEDHLVIDVVRKNGLELQVGKSTSTEEVLHNRAAVSQVDFAKLIPQGIHISGNNARVQVADKILSLEAQSHCPVGEIRLGQLLRKFCGLEIEEKLLVSHVIASDICELRHCSMRVVAAGGIFVAPTLKERVRVSREALRRALRACEGQVLSSYQPLLLQPVKDGPFINAIFVDGTSNCSADHAQDSCTQGLLCQDTQVLFLEADESVRLV